MTKGAHSNVLLFLEVLETHVLSMYLHRDMRQRSGSE